MIRLLVAQEALAVFKQLSHVQYATGWVLCQVGRALFEMVDFPQAAKAFEWARQVDQYRLEVRSRPPWYHIIWCPQLEAVPGK